MDKQNLIEVMKFIMQNKKELIEKYEDNYDNDNLYIQGLIRGLTVMVEDLEKLIKVGEENGNNEQENHR